MNRLFIFTKLIESKYNLLSNADDKESIMRDVKKDFITAFNLYVNSETPIENPYLIATSGQQINKNKRLAWLAASGEENSLYIHNIMKSLIDIIDTVSPKIMYNVLDKILNKAQNTKPIIDFYIDRIALPKQYDKQQRENMLRELKTEIKRLTSSLETLYKRLIKYVNKESTLEDRSYQPEVSKLSKDQLRQFTYTPEAQDLGLIDLYILENALTYPGMEELITNVINSIKRGHRPKRGNELETNLLLIKKYYNESKGKLNTEYFESES